LTIKGGEEYIAITKRIRRSHAQYLALGTDQLWLIFADKQVSDDFRSPLPEDLLEKVINAAVKDVPYDYRSRRVRSSRGFLDTGGGDDTDSGRTKARIVGGLLIREPLGQVLSTLLRHGYKYKWDRGDVGYFKGQLNNPKDVIESLEKNTGLHVIGKTKNRPN